MSVCDSLNEGEFEAVTSFDIEYVFVGLAVFDGVNSHVTELEGVGVAVWFGVLDCEASEENVGDGVFVGGGVIVTVRVELCC